LTKCTYFLNVAANAGAPAFKITTLGYWKFQLFYAEWSGEDMGSKFLSTNLYTGTVLAANANVFPSPIRGTYPASGTGPATLDWPTSTFVKANWGTDIVPAGSLGFFSQYILLPGSPFLSTSVMVDSGLMLHQWA